MPRAVRSPAQITKKQTKVRMSSPGLKRVGGRVFEEFLPELRFPYGLRVYDEMRKNSGTIGGILRAIEASFRSVKWMSLPADDSPEAAFNAAFAESCRTDMKTTWNNHVSDAFTFLPFGFAAMEMWCKERKGAGGNPRSKYTDGRIGFADIALIGHDSIQEWAYDPDDPNELIGLWQLAPPAYTRVMVPRSKWLHFRTRAEKDNPEGESILRQAYYHYYNMMRLETVENISLERTGAGIPVIHLPKGATTVADHGPDSDEAAAQEIVKSVRIDEQGGIVEPDGWVFRLERPNGRVDPELFDLPIRRHRSGMLMSVLAVFLELGTARVGSFALAEQGQNFFHTAFEAYVQSYEETYNGEAIPFLMEVNGITKLFPRLTHATVTGENVSAIVDAVKKLVDSGVLDGTDPMIGSYLKDLLNLPKSDNVRELEELPQRDPEQDLAGDIDGEVTDPERLARRRARRAEDDEGDLGGQNGA